MRRRLKENNEFKIYLSDMHAAPFEALAAFLCALENFSDALYILELRRARALVDLTSAQYCVRSKASIAILPPWVLEKIIAKESNCTCLYISNFSKAMTFCGFLDLTRRRFAED